MSDAFSLSLLKLPLALGLVIALIILVGALLKRYGPFAGAAPRRKARDRRLSVQDALALDGKRRLLLIRRDNVDHLILLGGPNDLLIESDIPVTEDEEQDTSPSTDSSPRSQDVQTDAVPALTAEGKESSRKERHEPTL